MSAMRHFDAMVLLSYVSNARRTLRIGSYAHNPFISRAPTQCDRSSAGTFTNLEKELCTFVPHPFLLYVHRFSNVKS
jgi:hypothetical protein